MLRPEHGLLRFQFRNCTRASSFDGLIERPVLRGATEGFAGLLLLAAAASARWPRRTARSLSSPRWSASTTPAPGIARRRKRPPPCSPRVGGRRDNRRARSRAEARRATTRFPAARSDSGPISAIFVRALRRARHRPGARSPSDRCSGVRRHVKQTRVAFAHDRDAFAVHERVEELRAFRQPHAQRAFLRPLRPSDPPRSATRPRARRAS